MKSSSGTFSEYFKIVDRTENIFKISGFDIVRNKNNSLVMYKFNLHDLAENSLNFAKRNFQIIEIGKNLFEKVSKIYNFFYP